MHDTFPSHAASLLNDPRWELTLAEEFSAGVIESSRWNHELGTGVDRGLTRWGNNEKQYYTNRTENSRVENGVLILEARAESFEGESYTSARINTQGKFEQRYGRVEARMRVPHGKGIWPAFWMMGRSSVTGDDWPSCGEIDIFETVGGSEELDRTVYGTVHYGPDAPRHEMNQGSLDTGHPIHTEWHRFGIVWTPSAIAWQFDDVIYHRVGIRDRPEFHDAAYILLCLAVGGFWPGDPDKTTVLPQRWLVDYIRVWKWNDAGDPLRDS